jgi:ankyrin repeat protein
MLHLLPFNIYDLKKKKMLLDAGADRNISNPLGWTALHEACFYNRIETVKTLLLGGADASMRTRSGALPFHLSGLAVVRTMLKVSNFNNIRRNLCH